MTEIEILEQIKKTCDAKIAKIHENNFMKLYDEVIKSQDKYLILLAKAALFERFGIKDKEFSPKELAYEIAGFNIDIYNCYKDQKNKLDLYFKITKFIDSTNFVFAYTHYDEFSNGFFFRRS